MRLTSAYVMSGRRNRNLLRTFLTLVSNVITVISRTATVDTHWISSHHVRVVSLVPVPPNTVLRLLEELEGIPWILNPMFPVPRVLRAPMLLLFTVMVPAMMIPFPERVTELTPILPTLMLVLTVPSRLRGPLKSSTVPALLKCALPMILVTPPTGMMPVRIFGGVVRLTTAPWSLLRVMLLEIMTTWPGPTRPAYAAVIRLRSRWALTWMRVTPTRLLLTIAFGGTVFVGVVVVVVGPPLLGLRDLGPMCMLVPVLAMRRPVTVRVAPPVLKCREHVLTSTGRPILAMTV